MSDNWLDISSTDDALFFIKAFDDVDIECLNTIESEIKTLRRQNGLLLEAIGMLMYDFDNTDRVAYIEAEKILEKINKLARGKE